MEPRINPFSYRIAERLAEVFSEYRVDYLFIGRSDAILYGFPDTTQDVDIFPRKDPENGERLLKALRRLGFAIDDPLRDAIIEGKDFIQIRGGPFDIKSKKASGREKDKEVIARLDSFAKFLAEKGYRH